MNRIISFILGALAMFVIMFSINVLKDDSMDMSETTNTNVAAEATAAKGDITKQIAFVNNDIGVGETNVASSLVNNMPMSNGYDLVTTTYDDATTGVENDKYVAYVMFDANYTSTLFSVATDELPEKAKITFKLNPNLNDEQLVEVNKLLFMDYLYVKDTINYIYIAYLLDIVHNTQNDVSEIIENEEYMNSISESVADYTLNLTKSLEDYLKEPPSTEIDLDISGLQEIVTKNIDQISAELGIDSDELLATIITAQAGFNETLNQSMLDSDVALNHIDLEIDEINDPNADLISDIINDYLIRNLGNLDVNNKLMIQSIEELTEYKSLLESSDILPDLEDIELVYIAKTILRAPFSDDADGSLSSLEGNYKFDVLNDFILSYAMWYSASNDIPLDTCDPSGTATCMDDYYAKYGENFQVWIDYESQLETIYNQITSSKDDQISTLNNLITYLDQTSVNNSVGHPLEVEKTEAYISDVLAGGEASQNLELTTDYCSNGFDNFIANFACGLQIIIANYSSAIADIDEYNNQVADKTQRITEHNSELDSKVEEINASIDTANNEVNGKLTTHDEAIVDGIDEKIIDINKKIVTVKDNVNKSISKVNEKKNNSITNLSELILDYQTQLNEDIGNVEKSQIEDRQKIYTDATTYLKEYTGIKDGYTTNIDLLTLFASILPSTRNGNEANYYLYNYLVNPLNIVQKTGIANKEETVDPIEGDDSQVETSLDREQSNDKVFALLILSFVLIVCLCIYLVIRRGDYDD